MPKIEDMFQDPERLDEDDPEVMEDLFEQLSASGTAQNNDPEPSALV